MIKSASLMLMLGAAACSRTGLKALPLAVEGTGGSGAQGSSAGSGGSPQPPPPPCWLTKVGEPRALLEFPEGDADGPEMVVLDPGSSASPARIAYQGISENANTWHPELRVADVRIGQAWPDGVTIAQGPTLYGFDAHAWGELAHAADGSGLALAFYHGDEASGSPAEGLKFRTFDPASWTPGNEVLVDVSGSVAYALAPGKSVGKGGSWSGAGYAVSWRAALVTGDAQPLVALIDTAGAVQLGPFSSAAPIVYPGRSDDVVWSGETYLVATAFDTCTNDDPLCASNAVVITRLLPAGLELAHFLPSLSPGTAPRRPAIAAFGSDVWIAWAERPPDDDAAPRTVRLAHLNPQGAPIGDAETLATGAHPGTGVAISATEAGVVVLWGEDVDPDLPPATVGHSKLVVHHRDPSGKPLEAPIEIPTTGFSYNPSPSAVVLASPRSVLLGWSGVAENGGVEIGFLARLDCHDAP